MAMTSKMFDIKEPFLKLVDLFNNNAGGAVYGSIVGGSNVEERPRCAQEVALRNVSGYWIGSFGLGESMEELPSLLNAVTDNLPKERPRMICGLGLPGVAAGVDLFDSVKGAAPIVEDCPCYTCQNHTKAYINHLLSVHEVLLALILLETHNTDHYLGFFRSIREAIKEGKFKQFQKKFVQSRREHLAADVISV